MSATNAPGGAELGGTDGESDGTEAIDADEDEPSPAEGFGTRIGVGLAAVALVWAFFGPGHILEVGRYELPIVASFVEPLPYRFFAYVGGIIFVLALGSALAVPSRVDDYQEGYATSLAMGLITPTVAATIVVAALGFLVPALFYAVSGELARAGMILVGIVVLAIGAFVLQTIAILAIAVVSAPLWAPAFAGAYVGSALHRVVA